ncbi:hypothetical protein G6F62_012036 [Rhizopus arrhizus]|uniref:Uncharacterized protein n=1 Tax=Rhizopus oryzae TaxID=64495 RepID=A0A9P6WWF8_RHIOR|nr:hypothetical protein G6F23_012333 [Rhizopus arrhizus]KAG0752816.1 hypothetical protein G6F24_013359 [Rhizopus arrhizus]KAG0778247.1 hypothetical protein G6F22_011344 [Rhizopus arrhizus]KAG0778877.1 hypothetical protein G6F21_012808 [Rhizopus arrhizus]KAG0804177.1 hypothetical protein G6F20_012909 [Rhizopus arrhizus]
MLPIKLSGDMAPNQGVSEEQDTDMEPAEEILFLDEDVAEDRQLKHSAKTTTIQQLQTTTTISNCNIVNVITEQPRKALGKNQKIQKNQEQGHYNIPQYGIPPGGRLSHFIHNWKKITINQWPLSVIN